MRLGGGEGDVITFLELEHRSDANARIAGA